MITPVNSLSEGANYHKIQIKFVGTGFHLNETLFLWERPLCIIILDSWPRERQMFMFSLLKKRSTGEHFAVRSIVFLSSLFSSRGGLPRPRRTSQGWQMRFGTSKGFQSEKFNGGSFCSTVQFRQYWAESKIRQEIMRCFRMGPLG